MTKVVKIPKNSPFYQQKYPFTIFWKVVAGERKLSVLEESDLILDEYDLKIRKLI